MLPYAPNYIMSRNHLLGGVRGTVSRYGQPDGAAEGIMDVGRYLSALPNPDRLSVCISAAVGQSMKQYFTGTLLDQMLPNSNFWVL